MEERAGFAQMHRVCRMKPIATGSARRRPAIGRARVFFSFELIVLCKTHRENFEKIRSRGSSMYLATPFVFRSLSARMNADCSLFVSKIPSGIGQNLFPRAVDCCEGDVLRRLIRQMHDIKYLRSTEHVCTYICISLAIISCWA